MGHRDVLYVVRDERTRSVLRAALDAGWEWLGYTKGGHVGIRWPQTGAEVYTGTTPGTNSWKQFAREVERVSGVTVWRKGNRRRSRKSLRDPDAAQVEASRRRYRAEQARQQADREAARQAENARALAARRARVADEHRREIEALMRPGWGR